METGSDSAPGAGDSFLVRNDFLLRRLHSLSGLIPVGAFMCVHLVANATVLDSPATFQKSVFGIHMLGKALPIVELLVNKYSKPVYWTQLAYIYGELNDDKKQFATLQAAYHHGALKRGSEKVFLAQLTSRTNSRCLPVK